MAQAETVAGERVRLGPFDDPFWAPGLGWYNDPDIIAMTSDDPSLLTEAQFREMIRADLENDRSVVFGIRSASDRPIGIGMLRHVDRVHGGCELHLTIGERDHQDRGCGTETIGLMRNYAFGRLGLHKVMSTPFAFNGRMIRCLEKCGFEREGLLRDALFVDGRFIDVVLMGAINSNDG